MFLCYKKYNNVAEIARKGTGFPAPLMIFHAGGYLLPAPMTL